MTIERPMFPPVSRRRMITGAAVAAVAISGPSPAISASAADPIFAALNAFSVADAAFYADSTGDIPDEVGNRWTDAVRAVICTQPTTLAGLSALTGFAREMVERQDSGDAGLPDDGWLPLTTTIDSAVRSMSGAGSAA